MSDSNSIKLWAFPGVQEEFKDKMSSHIVLPINTPIEQAINNIIANPENKIDTNKISDGYHTFGELYDHRINNYIAVCRVVAMTASIFKQHRIPCNEVWRSIRHSDGDLAFGGGWFVLGINKQKGKQITYHLPMEIWKKTDFAETLERAPEWDGHSSSDVLQRLIEL